MLDKRRDEDPTKTNVDFAAMWKVPKETLELVQTLCYQAISAPHNVAPRSKRPFSHTSEMNAHHWVNFAKVYGSYLIENCYQGQMNPAAEASARLLNMIKMALASTVSPDHVKKMLDAAAEIRNKFNADFPTIEKSMMMHLLLFHIPATIKRWVPVRGYWCFPFERLVLNDESFVTIRYNSLRFVTIRY